MDGKGVRENLLGESAVLSPDRGGAYMTVYLLYSVRVLQEQAWRKNLGESSYVGDD